MTIKIPKPENSMWTDDQWRAITESGKDILVAAAAGSGKTAVLVERIIKKITHPEQPADVDRLLVVTFTNAAAAEMRKRIGEALEKELKERPASLHLRRQLSLLNRASISTLHSFCLEVLRRYYYKIDLDPGFRIADGTEAELLRDEVMEELFEDEYSKEDNESFFDVVDRYSSDRSDLDLQILVRNLYDFSRSHPWPHFWLDQLVENYKVDDHTSIDELPWTADLVSDVQLQLKGAKAIVKTAMEVALLPDGPAPYAENLDQDLVLIEKLERASELSWSELYEEMQEATFKNLKRVKKDECNEELKKEAKKFRDKAKDQVSKLKEELFSRTPESFLDDLRETAPVIEVIVRLVKEFGDRYSQAKQDKAIVDFADLEHYCLDILQDESSDPNQLVPSDAAIDYQNQFVEVLVDEYQDTNFVQESILRLITKRNEQFGNMFMVGDVKQSIYRFRLAEPGLFLSKYKLFSKDGEDCDGIRIDLSKNFRSRAEVLDATNFLFNQIMDETVGEIAYDDDAALKKGATDYPNTGNMDAELLLIDRKGSFREEESEDDEDLDLETVQLEARAMAQKIRMMIGKDGHEPFKVYDRKRETMRPITYRDIVILLRSMPWAPTIMEEFKQQGIPVYAELSSGYFDATEVAIMMSLLKVIDNPYQDIPLASVLRSPIIGLNDDELAQVRIEEKQGNYYEAVKSFVKNENEHGEKPLFRTLKSFLEELDQWRVRARQGALSELIWQVYSETGYYDFVGGMPGGKQRQANLRALYDRARQYEATSFRGLFRFLRFIERMQDRGDDLGAARALGEQEDVVRMMTIHKSKGLEFPVVFAAGLNRQFNMMDLNGKVLLHKELGLGSKFVNPKLRISWPTLPQLTIKRRMRMELIAEEMRVLYVALTRAKEKLFLVGTVKDASKALEDWAQHLTNQQWILPDYDRAQSKSYLDWIGPALVRHQACSPLRNEVSIDDLPKELTEHPSKWQITCLNGFDLHDLKTEQQEQDEMITAALQSMASVPIESSRKSEVERRLTWGYSYKGAETHRSKQSVTEIKRQREAADPNSDMTLIRKFRAPISERPKFMQAKTLSAAERGTAMHMVMQHLNFNANYTEATLKEFVQTMVTKELLTQEQADAIDFASIQTLLKSELGNRLKQASFIQREIPFSVALSAAEAYADWPDHEKENVLIQGVVDCVFEDENGELILLDYKTDSIQDRFENGWEEAQDVLRDRYAVQIEQYTRALEQIWKRPIKEKFLYFFDGSHLLQM